MPMTLKDHEQLHDWLARAALAGAAACVIELLLSRSAAGSARAVGEALRVGFLILAVVPPRSVVDGMGVAILALAAAATTRLAPHYAIPLVAGLIGVGFARGLPAADRGLRRWVEVSGLGLLGALTGGVIARSLLETGALTSLFGAGIGALAGAAIAGTITGLGAIGLVLGPEEKVEPVLGTDLRILAAEVNSANAEVGALLRRAADAHRAAVEVVGGLGQAGEAPAARAAADDLVKRMVRFGREWLEIERRATDTRPETLTERVALLEARLEKSEDPIAKTELAKAIAAVRAQGGALREILAGRERAVARLEHQVATLERLKLAALRHRSADASRFQAELQPVVEELSEAGGDYDLASDAIRDADRESVDLNKEIGIVLEAATAGGEQPN